MSATLSQLRTQVRQNLGQTSAPSSGKWTDAEINQKINNSIRKLNRNFKIRDIDTSVTTDTTSLEYSFPTGFVEIDKIQLWNSALTTNYGELLSWKVWEDGGTKKICFNDVFDTSGYYLKIFGKKRLTELSSDTESVDCELEVELLVVLD